MTQMPVVIPGDGKAFSSLTSSVKTTFFFHSLSTTLTGKKETGNVNVNGPNYSLVFFKDSGGVWTHWRRMRMVKEEGRK